MAINVLGGIRTSFGQQNRLGRNGNPRTCACTGFGSCDAVRWGTVQPERAELGLGGRMISKALMVSRSRIGIRRSALQISVAISCIYPGDSEHHEWHRKRV